MKFIINNEEVSIEKGIVIAADEELRDSLSKSKAFKKGITLDSIQELFMLAETIDADFSIVNNTNAELLRIILRTAKTSNLIDH